MTELHRDNEHPEEEEQHQSAEQCSSAGGREPMSSSGRRPWRLKWLAGRTVHRTTATGAAGSSDEALHSSLNECVHRRNKSSSLKKSRRMLPQFVFRACTLAICFKFSNDCFRKGININLFLISFRKWYTVLVELLNIGLGIILSYNVNQIHQLVNGNKRNLEKANTRPARSDPQETSHRDKSELGGRNKTTQVAAVTAGAPSATAVTAGAPSATAVTAAIPSSVAPIESTPPKNAVSISRTTVKQRVQFYNEFFSPVWLLLLLLTCTGSLFNASQFERALSSALTGPTALTAAAVHLAAAPVLAGVVLALSVTPRGGRSGRSALSMVALSILTAINSLNGHSSGDPFQGKSLSSSTSPREVSANSWSGGALAAIIPPAWANVSGNPCAQESWQLLYWPPHDRCYNIFSQGPCSDGEEVYHDHESGTARCRCERGRVKHTATGSCYPAYSRGPCRPREYLHEPSPGLGAECRQFADCDAGYVFWPERDECYRQYTHGPCEHGDLLHLHPRTGWPTCGCDSELMRMQYWPHSDTCHELLSRGPCVTGHVFVYNSTTRSTQCACSPSLTSNYHRDTEQCYPLDSQGPCPPGHTFSLPTGAQEPMCTCLGGHLLHVPSGTCQRAYTRAVCLSGQFLKPDASAGVGVGRCTPVPCSTTGQLYNPDTDRCYPVGSSGPCAKGKLWVYERASSLRGRCHCDERLVGYWGPHDICYPLGERGPCPSRHVVTYTPSRGLACSCDRRRGYSRWKGRCERITAADLIRDLINSSNMDDASSAMMDPTDAHRNSVMHARALPFNTKITTPPRDITSTSTTTSTTSFPRTTTTTPKPTPTTTINTSTTAIATVPDGQHRVDTHEIITFSRDFPNSIEENSRHDGGEDNDIRKRIARLTHRGLITRRTRRPR